jgi:hypothetical protein
MNTQGLGLRQLFLLGGFLGGLEGRVGTSCKFVLEFLNSTRRIHKFQFAGVKRVANITNVDLQFLASTTGQETVPTSASHGGLLIIWVDAVFHNGFATVSERMK